MPKVLDAHALMAYFLKQQGFEKVRDILSLAGQGHENLYMSSVNLGEVYYATMRSYGEPRAEEVWQLVKTTFPIEVISADASLSKKAGFYKAKNSLPYADCFAAALAHQKQASLVTGDRDFESVQPEITIDWL